MINDGRYVYVFPMVMYGSFNCPEEAEVNALNHPQVLVYFSGSVAIDWEPVQDLFLPFTHNVLGSLESHV